MNNNRNGFTLSEVMVTFMVIGVIAAILIPMIVRAKPDVNKIMFKKAYYITERVVNDLINDEDLYPEDAANPGFMNTTQVTLNGVAYSGTSKFCSLFAQRVNTTGTVSCTSGKSTPASGATNLDSGNFTTTDGITWHIPIVAFTTTTPVTITVDINGTSEYTGKSPNCKYVSDATCPKPDQFEITIANDGKMSVSGAKETEYLKDLQ